MSTVRRRGLQMDDPLGVGQLTQGNEPPLEGGAATASQTAANRPVQASDRSSEDGQREEPRGAERQTATPRQTTARVPQPADSVAWREWSGITGVGSFRLPHELLVELSDAARGLGLPIGMIVTAAITQLLNRPPEQIAELVDRADDARIHGRRIARRRLIDRTGG
jgi:hypothetical protein